MFVGCCLFAVGCLAVEYYVLFVVGCLLVVACLSHC